MDSPQFKTNDGSALRMWRDTVKNPYLTQQHGRPIFDEVIYVEVISPGSRGSSPVFELERVMAPEAKMAEPLRGAKYDEYVQFLEAFKKGHENEGMAGTPLEEWPAISRTMAASLRESRIFTVEALASLSDEKLSAVGPDGRSWREQAKAFLEAAADSAAATRMAAELAVRDEALADKDRQIKELADRIAALEANKGKGKTPAPEPEKSADGTAIPAII